MSVYDDGKQLVGKGDPVILYSALIHPITSFLEDHAPRWLFLHYISASVKSQYVFEKSEKNTPSDVNIVLDKMVYW